MKTQQTTKIVNGVNTCKTCGKESIRNLEFCSTDCEYWPHLRKRCKIGVMTPGVA